VDICLSDFRFIIGTDAYSRGSVSASNRVPICLSQGFRLETRDYHISFPKNCYNSFLPLNYKTCNKKIRFSQIFLFVLPDGAKIGEIDEIHKLIRVEIAQNPGACHKPVLRQHGQVPQSDSAIAVEVINV